MPKMFTVIIIAPILFIHLQREQDANSDWPLKMPPPAMDILNILNNLEA